MDTLIATEMRRDSTTSWQGNDLVSFIFDTFYDRRTVVHLHDEPARRPLRRDDGERTAVQQRLESGVGDQDRPLRGRLDRGGGGAVQVAAVSARDDADLGLQRHAREAVEERDLDADARAAGARTVGIPAAAVRRDARRDRGSAQRRQPRREAVRDLEPDDRACGHAAALERSGGRGRPRREVRGDAGPRRRPDRQHRLRAGRGRRAADQPDAVQSVLSRRNATSSWRTRARSRSAACRQQRRRQFQRRLHRQQRRRADPVLQPPHRIARNPQVPLNVGGRLTGRAGRYSVGVLNIQTGDKEEEFGAPATNFSVVRVKRDVLRRSSIGLLFTNRSESTIGHRRQSLVRHRRHVRVLREPADQHVLGADRHRWTAARATTPAIAVSSITPATVIRCRSSG